MAWDLSCPDWEERIRACRSLVPDLPLNQADADRAVKIFNRLKLPDVPGTPTLEVAAGDWVRDIVAAWAGSIVDGVREITEIFLEVPKKNGKSTDAAAVMLTAMLTNRRPRAEFLLIGPTHTISEISFNQAIGMIDADPVLARSFRSQPHIKKINFVPSENQRRLGAVRSSLQVKTFDSKVLTGSKAVGVLVDELHALGKVAGAERVIGQIRGGRVPFPEGFLIFITTQSDEPPTGVFRSELIKARMIRDGAVPANGMLPVLYEFPADIISSGAWRDPVNWPMVNPNVGRSVRIDALATEWDTAQRAGEKEIRRWASQHLNIEIGLALGSSAWVGANYWEGCADRSLTLATLIERSEVIVIGIDAGGADDLLGFAVLGRERVTKRWLAWTRAWVHQDVLEMRKADIAPRLLDFARQGDVSIVESIGDDIRELGELVDQVAASGKLPDKNAIALDPHGIGEIVEELAARGFDTEQALVGIQQGWKLNAAINTLGRRLIGKDMFVHAGQPLMAWCVGNAKVEPKGNAISITKQAAGTAKIDPLMALFDAVAAMALNPSPGSGGPSVYETKELLILRA
jgi:phage terminase large subunit-like protein